MAYGRLKRTDEARAALAKAIEIVDTKSPKPDSGDRGEDWHNWIVASALLNEAKGLAKVSPVIPAQPEAPAASKEEK